MSSADEHYFRALDEIWRLRRALAREAAVLETHLTYKTFPKTRRVFAEEQIERMRQAACGHSEVAYAGQSYAGMRSAMERAGASQTFTRGDWEAATPRREPVDA